MPAAGPTKVVSGVYPVVLLVVDCSKMYVNGPGPAPLAVLVALTLVTDHVNVLGSPPKGTLLLEDTFSEIAGLAGAAIVINTCAAAAKFVGPAAVNLYVVLTVGETTKLLLVVPSLVVGAPATAVQVVPPLIDCSSNCVNGPLPEPKPQLRVELVPPP